MIKQYYKVVQGYVTEHPKVAIAISLVVFGVLLSGVEYVRAQGYIRHVDDYRRSVRVMKVVDRIERLSRAVDEQPNTLYCRLDVSLLVEERYRLESDTISPEQLADEAGEYVLDASPAPGFNSLAQFVPKVSEARGISVALDESLSEIHNLTRKDTHSEYCRLIVSALEEVYYVEALGTTQGVGALHVAQQNNFIDNVSIAQDRIKRIQAPPSLSEEHTLIFDYLNELRLDLQGDVTQYETFGRSIEARTNELKDVFAAIGTKTKELEKRQALLELYTSVLKPEE